MGTQLFNHAVRRFGEKAVENGVPAGVRVGANLAHIPTTPAGDRRKLLAGITQQEFVLEPTLLISLLCQRTTVSCWVLEMRPLLLFTFRSTSLMIFSESFRRQRARSFLTLKPEGR